MAFPSYVSVFGSPEATIKPFFLNIIGDEPADPRLALRNFLEIVAAKYLLLAASATPPAKFAIAKRVQNIDNDTQRHTYTLSFDLAITTVTVEDEPTQAA